MKTNCSNVRVFPATTNTVQPRIGQRMGVLTGEPLLGNAAGSGDRGEAVSSSTGTIGTGTAVPVPVLQYQYYMENPI